MNRSIPALALATLATAAGLIATPAAAAQSSPQAASTPASAAQALPTPARILAPKKYAPVTGRTLTVRVKQQPGARAFRAWLDGRSITRRFRRDGRRLRVARLRTKALAGGRHYIRIGATRRGERGFHHVSFVIGRRKVDLVRRVPVPTSTVPARGAGTIPLALRLSKRGAAVAAAPRGHKPILRIRLNGRRVSSRLPAARGRRTTVLSADEGLRRGRNVVRIQAYLKDGRYDAQRRVVKVPRHVPLAAAGRARRTIQGRSVRLSGRASVASAGRVRLGYRWRIVNRPKRSRARLHAARTATPSLTTDRHGSYLVALTVAERQGGRVKRSTDLVTAVARPNFPPMGVPLDTMATNNGVRGIAVGDDFYPTGPDANSAHLLVLDGVSLRREAFVTLPSDGTIDTAIDKVLSPYVSDLGDHLVVLTGPAGCCNASKTLPGEAFSYVFPLKAGRADIGQRGTSNVGLDLDPDDHPAGHLAGFLQYQGSSPYSFVQTDNFALDTRSSLTTRIPDETTAQAQHIYVLSSALGTVLDVPSTSAGQRAVANSKTRQLSQQWALLNQWSAPHFVVVNLKSGLCLAVTNASKERNAEVAQGPCDDVDPSAEQLWDPVRRRGGTYAVRNVNSGMVLTVKDDSTTSGTPVLQAPDNGAGGQRWQLNEELVAPQNGVFALVSKLGTALAAAGAPGGRLAAETETDGLGQQWLAVADPQHRDLFQIANVATGRCADVLGASNAAGAPIVEQQCDRSFQTKSQLWTWFPPLGPNHQALVNVNSGLALTVQDTAVVQAPDEGTEGQQWFWRKQQPAPRAHGVYVIASKLDTVLEPADSSTDNGRSVAARERTDLPSQRWRLFPDPEAPEKFQIIDNASGLCLDVTGASTSPGAEVAQWSCDSGHEQSNQLWTPTRQQDGSYALVNVHSGLTLTIQGNSKTSGTSVVQDTDSGADGQRWVFEPVEAAPREYGVFVLGSTLGPAIDLASGSTARGTPAVGAGETDQPSQQWLLVPAGDSGQRGSFALLNVKSGFCLEASSRSGAEVQQDNCAPNYDNDGQLWTPVARADGSGYSLVNRMSARVLGLQGGSTAPQVPVVQSPDAGTDAQTWSLRPLARTLTATVGETDYTLPFPLSWSGFAMLAIDAAARPLAEWPLLPSYANTGNRDQDALEQQNLAQELSAWGKTPGTTVLVQSVGSPRPTSRSWGDIGSAIAGLGGNEQVFDQLDGSGDYAFAGCSGCTGMPHASFPLTRAANADSLSGTLSRNSSSTLVPRIALPTQTTSPSLEALAYQAPGSWPIPATEGQRAALSWIAERIDLTGAACYAPPQPDVRSTYCNRFLDFSQKRQDLHDLQPPSDSSLGFTDDDFAVVSAELAKEFEWVSDVRKNLIPSLKEPFGSAEAAGIVDFLSIGKTIGDSLTTDGRTTDVNGWTVMPQVFDAVSVFLGLLPEAEPAVAMFELLAAGLDIAEEVTEQPDGEPVLGDFSAKVEQLGSELNDRYRAASESLDFVGDLLVTDYAKLSTAALAGTGKDPNRNWQICDQQTCGISPKDLNQGLTLGGRQWLWTHMLPAAFDRFEFAPPAGRQLGDITCIVNPFSIPIKYGNPFASVPGNATYGGIVTGFDSSGAPQTGRVWALGRGDFSKIAQDIRFPTSDIADLLFRPSRQGGVGLFRTTLFTEPAFHVADWTRGLPYGDTRIGENRCAWGEKPR